MTAREHEQASPMPCPQCRDGKPCGGWLRPATEAGGRRRWRCDKCGRAVIQLTGAARECARRYGWAGKGERERRIVAAVRDYAKRHGQGREERRGGRRERERGYGNGGHMV